MTSKENAICRSCGEGCSSGEFCAERVTKPKQIHVWVHLTTEPPKQRPGWVSRLKTWVARWFPAW